MTDQTAAEILEARTKEHVEQMFGLRHYADQVNKLNEIVQIEVTQATAANIVDARQFVSTLGTHFESITGGRGFGTPMKSFLESAQRWIDSAIDWKLKREAAIAARETKD